ncbi:MAG: helix-turn-helix transcriptional regulator [Solobacterium sp.]|jgi:transcriptional regulator with XRE-family HTH domain|nr:helix-turn-helix transcriptional regulator [Solobacterium sp.]MCH4206167.1 helix-turn-helix transcriptional regulator [Solobacterium sp.]MCH4227633.1 helix-turn-helix transcriptional regulator [Solobacterium sp.]MCH4282567.1 helix-turn-helix transcriptional regulator [Solobacterium sp.]
MTLKKAVSNRIFELCKEKNITYSALGIRSDVPHVTIHDLLVCRNEAPNLMTIKKLCDGFDITLDEFFNTAKFKDLKGQL